MAFSGELGLAVNNGYFFAQAPDFYLLSMCGQMRLRTSFIKLSTLLLRDLRIIDHHNGSVSLRTLVNDTFCKGVSKMHSKDSVHTAVYVVWTPFPTAPQLLYYYVFKNQMHVITVTHVVCKHRIEYELHSTQSMSMCHLALPSFHMRSMR